MNIKKILVVYLLCLTSLAHASIIADTTIIRSHLTALTKTKPFRTHANVAQLNQTAGYIQTILTKYAD